MAFKYFLRNHSRCNTLVVENPQLGTTTRCNLTGPHDLPLMRGIRQTSADVDLPPRLLCVEFWCLRIEHRRQRFDLGPQAFERPGLLECRNSSGRLLAHRSLLNVREKGCQRIEIASGKWIIFMIMALRTADGGPQPDRRDVANAVGSVLRSVLLLLLAVLLRLPPLKLAEDNVEQDEDLHERIGIFSSLA